MSGQTVSGREDRVAGEQRSGGEEENRNREAGERKNG